jgi:hypothetical protein
MLNVAFGPEGSLQQPMRESKRNAGIATLDLFHGEWIFGGLAGVRIVGPRAPSQRPIPVEPGVGDAAQDLVDEIPLGRAAERHLPIEIGAAAAGCDPARSYKGGLEPKAQSAIAAGITADQ